MPQLESSQHTGGNNKITRLINLEEVARALGRDEDVIAKYLSIELSTPCKSSKKYNGDYMLNGAFSKSELGEKILSFTKEYVTCGHCSNPETVFHKSKGARYLMCKACGNKTVLAVNKFTDFVFK